MKISETFSSAYLKAADLGGKKVKVKIESVEMADLGDSQKPVVKFKGKEKGLVLNKTNSMVLAGALGDDTDEWAGQEIYIFPTKVNFQGQMTDAIRVEAILQEATSEEAPF